MEKKIKIDFKNILSELEENQLTLCFLRGRGLFIEDSQNNLYQVETYWHNCCLDKLIKKGAEVEFIQVKHSLSKNIGDWEKEIWNISEVKDFIERQSPYW